MNARGAGWAGHVDPLIGAPASGNYLQLVQCPVSQHCWHASADATVGGVQMPADACCWCGSVRYRYDLQTKLADPRAHGNKLPQPTLAAPEWFWTRCVPWPGPAEARCPALLDGTHDRDYGRVGWPCRNCGHTTDPVR